MMENIAIGAAIIGVLATIVYIILLVLGVSALRDIKNILRNQQR